MAKSQRVILTLNFVDSNRQMTIFKCFFFCFVLGAQSKVVLHGREDVRHQLNQVFDALSMFNHKVSQFDNQGISTSTYEQQVRREREELYRVLYGLNIRKVDWGYGAPFQYSKVRKQKSDTTKNFSNSISVVN